MIPLVPGNVVVGKFELRRQLARGGMGSVWVARHLQLDCDVAIKFMDPSFAANASARVRFEREAKAAAQLRTPHVVQVYDHGVDEDTPYIAMELLDGEDLGARLKRKRRLTLSEMAPILEQLAKGLQRAHDAGIIHRDLKPGNVFLAKSDDGDLVKILDFGIAKAIAAPMKVGADGAPEGADEATQTGQILGSPHYMSPEQAKGSKDVDARSDLWSLGVIVYRAITGDRPFLGDTFGELVVAICTSELPPASSKIPHLPPSVDRFFEKALARDPGQRFQRAREMAAAFSALAESATDPSWTEGRRPLRSEPATSTGDVLAPGAVATRPTHAAKPELAAEVADGTLTNASGIVSAKAGTNARRPGATWMRVAAGGAILALGALALVLRVAQGREAHGPSAATPAATATPAPTAPAATASPGATTVPPTAAPSSAPAPSAEPVRADARDAAAAPPTPDHEPAAVEATHGARPRTVGKRVAKPAPTAAPAPAPPPKEKPNFGY